MANTDKQYIKTVDDEIDWKIIDQLHAATLNFSNLSLELKKLLFVLIGIAIPSLVKLAGDKLDLSLFVTIYLLASAFWLLDSFTYFYQEKLREKMDARFKQIKNRHALLPIVLPSNEDNYTLDNSRTSKNRIKRSIINASTRLYFIVIILDTLALFLFLFDYIK
ncbi:hypothetical protein [Terrimonas ferruginea]|uniref:hypothetical protein n=1 Tax=Terrimonas ferruginea TaxID=249 RepID=UPI00048F9BF9|nr:hypothetical protein [Terrimonas ferruginea]